jgi:hypothetical protein
MDFRADMHSLLDIVIKNLPAECNTEFHLETVGFFIQDVVSEVEERMPEYKGEYLDTSMCLLPVVNTTRRRLQLVTGTYTYKGTGRCRRCKTRNADRRLRQNRFLTLFGFGQRYLQSDCTEETETATIQKDLAVAATQAADTALMDLTELAQPFQQNEEVKSIIASAKITNRKVKEESTLASTAAQLTISWCSQAAKTQLQYRIDEYQNNVQEAMTDTVNAALRARNALDQVKAAKIDMD